MGIIAVPLGYLLTFIYNLVGNYGISLIILTVLVKLILYPLYFKQIKSTASMSTLQPKMKALQEKYKNDKEKEFTIHLPLPSSIDKDWGIGLKQITPQLPFNDERFYKIDIDLDTYNSLYDYVNDLIINGVCELCAREFTFEGVKIKIKKMRQYIS